MDKKFLLTLALSCVVYAVKPSIADVSAQVPQSVLMSIQDQFKDLEQQVAALIPPAPGDSAEVPQSVLASIIDQLKSLEQQVAALIPPGE